MEPSLCVTREQIDLIESCRVNMVPEHGLFENVVVQMKSTDGNNVSYFKFGFPPRSKNKFRPDNQRIDSNGEFGLRAGRGKKKKSKVSGTFNSNTYDEDSRMMQSRSKNAYYHKSWENVKNIATDTADEKNKRKCGICGETGHTWKDCVKFFNIYGDVVKDEERVPGHYAIYECTHKVAKELRSFEKELLLPPQDCIAKKISTANCKGDLCGSAICDGEGTICDRDETICNQGPFQDRKANVKNKTKTIRKVKKKKRLEERFNEYEKKSSSHNQSIRMR